MLECAQYEVGKGQLISKCLLVNFVFSKKATKIGFGFEPSPFHREWPQLITILTSFDLLFEKKFKSLKY